jgi:SAM-dependent methyltransferase
VPSDLDRELEYHEKLYSGFAQQHFAKPAVRAFREHQVGRMMRLAGIGRESRVLSAGCGIADMELVLAPYAREVVGNFRGVCGTLEQAADGLGKFDAVLAVFFLHHLSDEALEVFPKLIASLLKPGGVFYGLDPSRYRLSGWVGELLFPKLMARYQSPGERQLSPPETAELFGRNGFVSEFGYYDFVSTPLAGLLPSWRWGYRATRVVDEVLVRTPGLRRVSSNFEVIARWGGGA